MSQVAYAFDPLECFDRFKSAGVETQARIFADSLRIQADLQQIALKDGLREYSANNFSHFSTKNDIQSLESEIQETKLSLEAQIQDVENRLTARIQEVDTGLSLKIQEVDARLSARIEAVHNELQETRIALEAKILAAENRLEARMATHGRRYE